MNEVSFPDVIQPLIDMGVLSREEMPTLNYWHWTVLKVAQLPPSLHDQYIAYGEIRWYGGVPEQVGVINASMIGTPYTPGEHVDWNEPDYLSTIEFEFNTEESVESFAANNPHMIVFVTKEGTVK